MSVQTRDSAVLTVKVISICSHVKIRLAGNQ